MTNASNPKQRRSASPAGTPRAGRRDSERRRTTAEPGFLERYRTPLVAIVVIALVGVVGAAVVGSATAASYECSIVDTVDGSATDGGKLQADQGNTHVGVNEKVTYALCPPASGKHVNRSGFGPLEPRVYGPDDRSNPQGWVHNLEHGGLVLLYSCERGACDDATIESLRQFSQGFPDSAICGLPGGFVGPVVARFEQMPTRFAALLWGRALYLDTLDAQAVYDFYLQYGEVVQDGSWIAPPEPQCVAPTPTPAPSAN